MGAFFGAVGRRTRFRGRVGGNRGFMPLWRRLWGRGRQLNGPLAVFIGL